MNISEAKDLVKESVREKLGYGNEYTDEDVLEIIDNCVITSEEIRSLPISEKRRIGKEIFDSLRRLDILQSFIENKDVTEIMINGHKNVFVEKAGSLSKLDRGFDSEEKLMDVVQQILFAVLVHQ